MKTRIFLFILLCFILANINAQDNKDDLSNSKELTGIWEINLGDSYETVKAVMQKRDWTASSMSSNEKKAMKNRESLGLDPRPTYTFKKQDGTFGNTKVSKISFSFFQNQLYDIQINFFDLNNKNEIEYSHLQNDLIEVYSLDFDDKQTFDNINPKTNYTSSTINEFYHAKNSFSISFSKIKEFFPETSMTRRVTLFSLIINIYSKEVKTKVETQFLEEISNDIKPSNELNGIFEISFGDNKDTAIAIMTKRKWVIKSRDRKKNEKIVFTKINGTFALWPVQELQLFFEEEALDGINIIFGVKKSITLEDFHIKNSLRELNLYELIEQIKNIYNLNYIGEKEDITKGNSSSTEFILKYKIFQNSNSNTISLIKCITNNNNNTTTYAISILKSLQPEDPEKKNGRFDKLIEDL